MSLLPTKTTKICDLKPQNESDSTNESTVYLEFEGTTEKLSNSQFYASNKEEIRAALERLHEKLKQLKLDRDLAKRSKENILNTRERQKNASNYAFHLSLEHANNDCGAIEEKLAKILHNTRLEMSRKLNYELSPLIEPKSRVKIDKMSSINRFKANGETKRQEMVDTTKKQRPKDEILFKQTHFVVSGVSSETYSLTANMQTLINVLALQNPRLAVETNSFIIIDEILSILERYLRNMVSVLRETICFLTIKWMETVKMIQAPDIDCETLLLKRKTKVLKMKREALTSHLDEVVKLQGQVQSLQKRRKGLTEVKSSKPKLKRGKKVSERIHGVENDFNVELLKCLKRLLFLLKL